MKDYFDELITNSTVRLQNSTDLNYIGTGIIYYNENLKDKVYILTASHCLFIDGDDFKNPRKDININFYNPISKHYETVNWKINLDCLFTEINKDIAVLIIDKSIVENIIKKIPIIKVVNERDSYLNFITKGFPKATLSEELAVLYPTWLQKIDDKRFQIQLNEDYSEYNTQGFSGSGVFLIANDEIYLFGIFTRFRPEEKGKVIYCQYIDSINELLHKNYASKISFSYFGNYGLTSEFFNKHIKNSLKGLGPRFNEDLNFQLPIAKIFNDIAKDDYFFIRFLNLVDNWIVEKGYRKLKDNIHLTKIEKEYEKIKIKTVNWIKTLDNSVTQKIDVKWLLESLDKLNDSIDVKSREVYNLRREEEKRDKNVKQDYTYHTPYEKESSRLREIKQANYDFIDAISNEVNVNLANNPYLIITGDAGNGKSHLLGDVAKKRIERNLPTLLLLGQQFSSSKDIWENIKSNSSIVCTNIQLLETLNNIGKHIGSRVLVLVDAINEGAGADLWHSRIASFINEFSNYPFIGLVLTIRTTYVDFVIPENLKNDSNITFKTHEGFKGNEYAALKLFCEFHGIKQPNFPILAPEFTKPLFLQLICDAIKDTPDKTFPQGFQGISSVFEIYINSINRKFQNKREEYKYCNVVLEAIHKVAFSNYNNNNKPLLLKEVKEMLKIDFPDHKLLINDLIEESIFITNPLENYETNQQEEIIYFAYQRFGDFYVAEELLKKFNNTDEVLNSFKKENELGKLITASNRYWYNNGILEALAILLPEIFKLEIFEVYSWYFECDVEKIYKEEVTDELNKFLFDSLNWRKIESIDDVKLTNWFRGEHFYISEDDLFNKLIELSTVIGHPFNSDRLYKILKSYKMPKRDSFWQKHLRWYNGHSDDGTGFPIRRLIDWAWTPEISNKLDFETARLTAQTLAWVLTSTNIKLRDQTTKAMVNLLEQQPDALIAILKSFKNIDDLYISERLYAIGYGCVLRTENIESINKIAMVVYNYIFKKGNPPKHILLRDYARNTIEYGLYKNPKLKIDISLLRPPYKSKMPEKMPSSGDVKKYNIDREEKNFKRNSGRMSNLIHHSVVSWDFGRYTVESAFRNFSSFSFTFEETYKNFYDSLNRKQKENLRTLISTLKTKFSFKNKESRWIQSQGKVNYELYINSLDEIIEKILDFTKKAFNQDEFNYIENKIIPHFNSKFEESSRYKNNLSIQPIKYWIVQRVFELGYNYKIHGEYDENVESFNVRSENKIERIGKKYQWLAFFEILAMVSDNYLFYNDDSNKKDKYEFYKGPWQMYIRNIDPAFTLKNIEESDEKDDLGILDKKLKWWEDADYKYWNQLDSEWIEKLEDLPKLKDVIEKNDVTSNEDWLFLKKFVSWNEPKPIGKDKYEVRRKEIFYKIQGYLISKKDKTKILKWLKVQNFWGDWMPQSSDFSRLINREKFWSPAYFDSDKENKWKAIRNTNLKLIIASSNAVGEMSEDKSGAHFGYDMPCKTIFEGMNLQYAPIDGEFKNNLNKIIVTNKNYKGLLIKKTEILEFLNKNNLDVIWTVLGDKRSFHSYRGNNYLKELSGVYYLEDGEIKGNTISFTRE